VVGHGYNLKQGNGAIDIHKLGLRIISWKVAVAIHQSTWNACAVPARKCPVSCDTIPRLLSVFFHEWKDFIIDGN
jgi:hypothetical protein